MLFWKVFILLFISKDSLCFDGWNRATEKQTGYYIKSVHRDDNRGRSRQNSIVRDDVKLDYDFGGVARDDAKKTVVIVAEPTYMVKDAFLKEVPVDRLTNRSDPALPLHVTSTARQQCMDGYQADENGICQKTMQPKNEKSFKLRRRKRAEQTAPKLSYADVVKYGRNPPKELFTTIKAEVLTKKPDQIKIPVTTLRTIVTNQPKSFELSKTSAKAPVTLPVTARAAAVTQRPAVPTTIKPGTPGIVASKTDKPAAAVTVAPVAKPTKKPSIFGDINQAFLSGEKTAVVSQSADGKVKPVVVPVAAKKTIDASRLRRWIGAF